MPKHEFVLETRSVDDNYSYSSFCWDASGGLSRAGLKVKDYASFDDEFIEYIKDSLNWVSTWNPSTQETDQGLNNDGVTVIKEQSLVIFKGIIESWMAMFEFAPDKIKLTGNYTIEGTGQLGQYENLEYNKSDLLRKLTTLVELIDRAIAEEKCILHLGI